MSCFRTFRIWIIYYHRPRLPCPQMGEAEGGGGGDEMKSPHRSIKALPLFFSRRTVQRRAQGRQLDTLLGAWADSFLHTPYRSWLIAGVEHWLPCSKTLPVTRAGSYVKFQAITSLPKTHRHKAGIDVCHQNHRVLTFCSVLVTSHSHIC